MRTRSLSAGRGCGGNLQGLCSFVACVLLIFSVGMSAGFASANTGHEIIGKDHYNEHPDFASRHCHPGFECQPSAVLLGTNGLAALVQFDQL